jgi:prophage maintenance system killer protein
MRKKLTRPGNSLALVLDKRLLDRVGIGLVAMLAFLGLNGRRLEAPDDEPTDLVLGVAEGRVTKAEVAVFVRRHRVARPSR